MSGNDERIATVRRAMEVGWTSTDEERAIRRFRAARTRRRRIGVAAALGGMAAVAGAVALWMAPPPPVASRVQPRSLEATVLADGTGVTPLVPTTAFAAAEISPARVVVKLTRGAARFRVARRPSRLFRVEAPGLVVEVLGTEFTVDLTERSPRVDVSSGKVRVLHGGRETLLAAGQAASFREPPPSRFGDSAPPPAERAPPAGIASAPLAGGAQASTHAAGGAPATPPLAGGAAQRPRGGWRQLARGASYDRAFAALAAEGPAGVRDEPGDLLLAADVARLSGHPAKAIPLLRKLLSSHRRDTRAPLGAFTLGRILLDELGRPAEAAEAFTEALRLSPRGQLAEDALARQADAWHAAGAPGRAAEAARRYLAAYPGGRRAGSMRRLAAP